MGLQRRVIVDLIRSPAGQLQYEMSIRVAAAGEPADVPGVRLGAAKRMVDRCLAEYD